MIDVAANPSDAVEKALDLFGNDILRLAYSYMKSREDAEDIVQEVLIRLMQSAGVFEDESHEKAWLLKVASNLCKDKLKSASRQREVAIPEGYDVADEKQEQKEAIFCKSYHNCLKSTGVPSICIITKSTPLRKLQRY